MAIELTYDSVLGAANLIVREKGYEYFYTPESGWRFDGMSCSNWKRDEYDEKVPDCIVGTILHRLGVPLESMLQCVSSGYLVEALAADGVIEKVGQDVKDFLDMAQVLQDTGATWHSAVNGAARHAVALESKRNEIGALKSEISWLTSKSE